MMKLAVVSICRNEENTVEKLINLIPKKIRGVGYIETFIINDGSTDKTAELAARAGATVSGDNQSKGLAVRFRETVNMVLERGFDVMVNIDGDLQFNPEDIPMFVDPIVNDEADFVAADRFTSPKTGKSRRPQNMPAPKYYGNKLGAWAVSKLSDEKFRDVTCGFRSYNQKALYALNINGSHTYTQESFQIMAARKMRIKAIPVDVKYFKGRKSRVVTGVVSYMAISMLNILRAFRDFAPLRFFVYLGGIPFIVGLLFMSFVFIHWLIYGSFSPYKFVGFTGLYLFTLGIFFWSLGLTSDMQVRILNNQEKTYEELRRLSHRKNK